MAINSREKQALLATVRQLVMELEPHVHDDTTVHNLVKVLEDVNTYLTDDLVKGLASTRMQAALQAVEAQMLQGLTPGGVTYVDPAVNPYVQQARPQDDIRMLMQQAQMQMASNDAARYAARNTHVLSAVIHVPHEVQGAERVRYIDHAVQARAREMGAKAHADGFIKIGPVVKDPHTFSERVTVEMRIVRPPKP